MQKHSGADLLSSCHEHKQERRLVMTQETETRKPALYIYTKVAEGNKDRIGSRIGVAFNHKESEGLNIILDAQPLPIEGRIQLVGFPPKEKE